MAEYQYLNGLIGDTLRNTSVAAQINKKWEIVNLLPTDLHLYYQPSFTEKVNDMGIIKAHGKREFEPWKFRNKDELYVFYEHGDIKIPFLEPHIISEQYKHIELGAVSYRSSAGHLQVQASNWDMPGIMIHNMLRVPLDIYYKGNLAAQVSAYNGLSYMAGGASSIYFDNDRQGLDMFDEITFSYSFPGKAGKELFTVTIDDNQCQEMYVGTVSNGFTGPAPDTFDYSIDKPVWTGITYYRPSSYGTSYSTNPFAAI